MKNYENILIERMPKTIFKTSFGLKNFPDSLLMLLGVKTSSYTVSIFLIVKTTLYVFIFFFLLFHISTVYKKLKPKSSGISLKCP